MKITKNQIKRIIKEEKSKISKEPKRLVPPSTLWNFGPNSERQRSLSEGSIEQGFSSDEVAEFAEIMGQLNELLNHAFEICGRDSAAQSYWYNTMVGCIEGRATMTPMSETLKMMEENTFHNEEY